MAMVMVVLAVFAGLAFADQNTTVHTTVGVNATATGGNAQQGQIQGQQQGQQQGQDAHSSAIVTSPREHITATPGVVGGIATLAPIVSDGQWHALLCDSYTVEELKNMKDSSSYTDRGGFYFFNIFTSPIERTVRVKKYNGEVKDSAVVRLVPDFPGNRTVAEYNGTGAKGAPLSAIVAYAALEGVYDTGEYALVVEYRSRDIAQLRGLGVGSGAAAAVSSADSARAGSMSVGAIIGSSEAYAEYVYDIKVKVVKVSGEAINAAQLACYPPQPAQQTAPAPAPPVFKEEPKPAPAPEVKPECNLERILKEIKAAEAKIATCWRYCHSNMYERLVAARASLDAYVCTGNRRYLADAIEHYQMAELNYIHGFDIREHGDSNSIIAEVEYGLASAFYARDHSIDAYWKAPVYVKHEDKKNGADKWVKATKYEKTEIMKIRRTLERYSTNLTLS